MMQKLFRRVNRQERRPDKNGTYATSRGDCLYYTNLDGFLDEIGLRIMPEYWYEPVEIPTDEEIDRLEKEEYGSDKYAYNRERDGFWVGFKAAINHLTGGK